jgi:hypothetical protein
MTRRKTSFLEAAVVFACIAAVVMSATPAGAWGFTAHFIITQAAIEALPPGLRTFYQSHADFVAAHSIDPDKWRWDDLDWSTVCSPERGLLVLEGDERPRHFLDADAVSAYPFSEIPRDFSQYQEMAGDEWEEWGSAPWTAAAYTALLREEMGATDPDLHRVLCRSAILAHYVADLSMPFHLTVNYDGQLSGLRGIHSRFERHLVEYYDEVLKTRVRASAPQALILGSPIEATFEMLVDGYPAVHALLRADLLAQRVAPLNGGESAGDNPAYMREMWEQSGDLAAARMAYGAEKVASFWLTAWDQAGRPDLRTLSSGGLPGNPR